ncbi:PepSY-associated TM helix domain-containing protein [Aequorivita xiaoshiensis]|uniref:PepSY domain-containing protein n=1 Tax=Aequorivita xiaoshiensis TaxID=2874476 RepID=A0A9X1U386_9FLAO|nr:PepSY-associated TM helix domain-containing protein [Aequorivita xiaoshiensis]MCG2429555.1 PepSY domain-containing protein [Aequorivita xiaoshiensis]
MKTKKYTLRRFINDVHLWLGVGSGIILLIICLTGTILTFEEEIKSVFAEEITVSPTETKLPIEQLAQKLISEGEVMRVSIRPEPTKPYEFSVKTNKNDRRGTTFFVDQYKGEYAKKPENPLDGFFMANFKLHRWLLLDISIGRPIVGISTIIFLILSISGIVLWFPKKKLSKLKWKHLKPGLKIGWRGKWKRINHDLHVTLGFYTAIFLVIMSITGLFWSFQWYRDAGSAVLGTKVFGGRGGGPKIESTLNLDKSSVEFTDILSITERELPFEGTTVLQIPTVEKEIFNIRKYHDQDFFKTAVDELKIDRDGSIIAKEIFSEKPLNEQIASSIKSLHMGTIFGWFSKTIYFISCLIATSLPITGVIIWLKKLKDKKKKLAKKKA